MAKSKHIMTERAIARMLVENTGTHFLDSGGAYGRAWQRNQGKTVDTFLAAPQVSVTAFSDGDGYVTLDVFHYLTSKLEYSHNLTLGFQSFSRAAVRANDYWLQNVYQYVAYRVTGDANTDESEVKKTLEKQNSYCPYVSDNSYNSENLLSQDIQFTMWWDDRLSTHLIALQIHGGCDARGGYTEPKIFEVTTDEPWDFLDWQSYSVVCTALGSEDQVLAARMAEAVEWQKGFQRARVEMLPGMPYIPPPAWESEPWADIHCWDTRSGEWIHYGGNFVDAPWKGNGPDGEDAPMFQQGVNEAGIVDSSLDCVLCPECGAPAEVYAR